MKPSTKAQKPRRIFGWLSLAVPLVPVIFLATLLIGGGSSGFGVWNDVVWLLGLMLAGAIIGIILSMISFKREEKTIANGIALFIHVSFMILVVYALLQ